jgi:hypothetical protein
MAMSSAGLLYVANACPSTMVVYGSSWSTPLRTIGSGLDGPVAIGIAL